MLNKRVIIVVAVAFGILTTVGVTSAVVGIGPAGALFDREQAQPPALLSFESAGAQCTGDFAANVSTTVRSGGANTVITHARNVSLPSAPHSLKDPTLQRLNDSTYLLSVQTEETSKASRDCAGVARYNASMRIPAGDDPWRVIIQQDGQNISTIFGDSNSSLLSGSASAGGSASA